MSESYLHPLYSTWEGMRQRCNNPNHRAYPYYGGRGVTICKRWDHFPSFLSDVGSKPFSSATLDRIDTEGNYEPSNVRWADRSTQTTNQRIRRDNSTGAKGIHWFARTNRWMAYINHKGNRHHLGYYKDFDDALFARTCAEQLSGDKLGKYLSALKEKLSNIPNSGQFQCR